MQPQLKVWFRESKTFYNNYYKEFKGGLALNICTLHLYPNLHLPYGLANTLKD